MLNHRKRRDTDLLNEVLLLEDDENHKRIIPDYECEIIAVETLATLKDAIMPPANKKPTIVSGSFFPPLPRAQQRKLNSAVNSVFQVEKPLRGPAKPKKPASNLKLDHVKTIIKDEKVFCSSDAAKKLKIPVQVLNSFLHANHTSYTKIKLDGVTDAKLLAALQVDMQIATAAIILGVEPIHLSRYLAAEKQHINHQLFSPNNPRP